jgi:beta-glucosidase
MPFLTCLVLLTGILAPLQDQKPLYMDSTKPVEARVEDLLSRMTLEEKISMLHGDSKFTTAAIPRLGLRRRWMSDGPHGVREDVGPDTWNPAGHTDDFSTFMPVNICLASTWNPQLGFDFGATIGQEAKARGKNIMLAPGVNIMRTPLNGRNFEYLGEDPFLSSRMAVGYIKGEQAQDVSSCVKHFAGNNQEFQRNSIDVEMDERTLREIYLPAFKAAVQEGGVLSVMGAYNKFRGQYCCENNYLLNKVLKGDWGFKGLVMSDWAGAHSTEGAVLNGLDLEMGTDGPYNKFYLADPFMDGIRSGKYPASILDDKVRRNLRVMFTSNALDSKSKGSLNTSEHQATARKVAEEGIVLLKNEGSILPLDPKSVKSIAVIGENASKKFAAGGGSAGIKAFYEITPLEGLIKRAGNDVDIEYSAGYVQPPFRRRGNPDSAGVQQGNVVDQAVVSAERIDRAVKLAKSCDVAIVFAGLNHGNGFDTEGADRKDMKLPFGQDELIQKVRAANPRTVVVIMSGGPVEMDAWINQVPCLLQAWYPGMEGGTAVARVLFGDVNPSGKLPCTFPHKLEDSPAHALNAYPGKDGVETYVEGLLVGYRWFDEKKIEPLFPFGFGLSYTKFEYKNLKMVAGEHSTVTVNIDVTNIGERAGGEVVQIYVQPGKEALARPRQELKGFKLRRFKSFWMQIRSRITILLEGPGWPKRAFTTFRLAVRRAILGRRVLAS